MIPIDHVLYINLDHRTDKLEALHTKFTNVGIPNDKTTRINAIYTPGNGVLGCALSHCKALELAKSHPEWEWTLIVEDDVTFNQNPWDEIRDALSVKPDVLMAFRGACTINIDSRNLRRVYRACSAVAYIVRKGYIPTLLQNMYECTRKMIQPGGCDPHDVYWYSLQDSDIWYGFLESPLGVDLEFKSDIREQHDSISK
jgi:GR25 family glycosyltransferase involved in LPS biosynthesis